MPSSSIMHGMMPSCSSFLNAPPFPASKAQLEEMGLKGDALEKAIEDNKKYAEFWSTHAFVKD